MTFWKTASSFKLHEYLHLWNDKIMINPLNLAAKKDDVYKIEEILKKRKKGRRVQYLVKWLGYPSSFNSWIFSSDLQKRNAHLKWISRTDGTERYG